jgi:hypothetical protein
MPNVTPGEFFLADDEHRVLSGGRYGAHDPEVVGDFAPSDIMAVQDLSEQTANACLFAASKHFRAAVAGLLITGHYNGAYASEEQLAWAAEVLQGDKLTAAEHWKRAIELEQGQE